MQLSYSTTEENAKLSINLIPTLYGENSVRPRRTLLSGFINYLKNDETQQTGETTEEQGDAHTGNKGIQGKER